MTIKEAAFLALRLRYNSAYAAHQSCLRAIAHGSAATGKTRLAEVSPSSADLLANEAKALNGLTEARRNLLAAMTEVASGDVGA
jgi:hypothetical protein